MISNPAIEKFINELTPDDVGNEVVDGLTVYFEGFVYDCWVDATDKGHTQESMEKELLEDWAGRLNHDKELISYGWTNGYEPFEDTIFYAIYR